MGSETLIDCLAESFMVHGEKTAVTFLRNEEAEEVINLMDRVLESPVVGIPDEKWGEKVVAAIVAKKGSTLQVSSSLPQTEFYSGMFPCLRSGMETFLFRSIMSALMSFGLVSSGRITSSMYPTSAAL